MTDIVERLRGYRWPQGDMEQCAREAADEIERLEHMKANLHGHIKRLEEELTAMRVKLSHAEHRGMELYDENTLLRNRSASLEAENEALRKVTERQICLTGTAEAELERLREAMEKALEARGYQPDVLDILRAALQKDEEPDAFTRFRTEG